LLNRLKRLFGSPLLYVKIYRNRLVVRDVHAGIYYEDQPLVVLTEGDNPTILSIGAQPQGVSPRVVNPFAHPRVIVDDFEIAEKVIRFAFKQVLGKRLVIMTRPVVVMHPLVRLEGGLAGIERRALCELATSAGAGTVHVWEGRELSDDEIQQRIYLDQPTS
jgi:rod shape-determining protein MreB